MYLLLNRFTELFRRNHGLWTAFSNICNGFHDLLWMLVHFFASNSAAKDVLFPFSWKSRESRRCGFLDHNMHRLRYIRWCSDRNLRGKPPVPPLPFSRERLSPLRDVLGIAGLAIFLRSQNREAMIMHAMNTISAKGLIAVPAKTLFAENTELGRTSDTFLCRRLTKWP